MIILCRRITHGNPWVMHAKMTSHGNPMGNIFFVWEIYGYPSPNHMQPTLLTFFFLQTYGEVEKYLII